MTIYLEQLKELVENILKGVSVPPGEAAIVSDSLILSDLRGIESHGLVRLPAYVERIEKGMMKPMTEFQVIRDGGAVLVCDACNGWGQVAALRAMEGCIAKAKTYGVGLATVKRSNHFGAAFYYSLAASKKGYLGFAMTNAGPSMAAWGGTKPLIGNNPFSVSSPAPWGSFCVDMALSTVARGKIRLAARDRQEIPSTWALDKGGLPTTDPIAALEGTLQAVGGEKGYAMALIVDLLSGVLSGGDYGPDVSGVYNCSQQSGVGHFLMAIDPSFFLSKKEFMERMGDWRDKIIQEKLQVRLPGERASQQEEKNKKGWEINEKTYREVEKLADAYHIPIP